MILAVDPGLLGWAYAIFDYEDKLIFSKTVINTKKMPQEQKLRIVFEELDQLPFEIHHVVIERQFVDVMSQITGVIRRSNR